MRSRRVILNDSPNSNTSAGTYCGKTAPVPMHDSHSWRNQEVLSGLLPVIRQQAMQLQSQKMRENTQILTDMQDVTSVRRQHPYAGNKHATKGPAKHQHSRQGAIRNAFTNDI